MTIQEKAFPNPHLTHETGMTLRDYFAAKALVVVLPNNRAFPMDAARAAYKYADAMMEARK